MLSYRLLCSDNETDIANIQAVFEATPNYFKLIQGHQVEKNEPYRVCRRVNILRDYPDDKTKLYPRN
ncbi:hypothetical protein F907_00068 [Acinetobacter colistiniresistens]|uniref:Uncharacterized protein n=1 Tax=Acinetobacter colistiniresistens TaxID=280145 RepID=S3TSK0_9GAMM|nr:hypothetical protein F907_00068 [Acinetobacter colistiniresistens]